MRFLWVLVAVLPAAGNDWPDEVRRRGAELEAAHRWEEAGELYQSMLGDLRGADLDSRFWLLTSLAEVEFERQDYGQSERWLHQAEQTIEGLPSNAPERARLLNAWGTLHLVQGNLTAAERELSRAVHLGEPAAPAEDHAAALHNLAAVEMHLGRLPEAAAHETQALAIWKKHFGERHYYVMKAWISLSSLQGLRGDWRAAEESLRHALAIGESEEALSNYAVVLEKLKRGREAKAIRSRLQHSLTPPAAVVDVKSLVQHREPAVRTR
jgi:tetratricopeptide (TPR) repeat protein